MAVNVSTVISSLWPALGALIEEHAVWWDAAELYAWANDTLRRFRPAHIYVEATQYNLTAGVQNYALPAKASLLLGVTYQGRFVPRYTPRELDALRQAWKTYSAPSGPEFIVEAASTDNAFAVVPAPEATTGQLVALTVGLPADVSSGSPSAAVPAWMSEVLYLGMLAGAKGRETEGSMPESAAAAERVVALIEQAASQLFAVRK